MTVAVNLVFGAVLVFLPFAIGHIFLSTISMGMDDAILIFIAQTVTVAFGVLLFFRGLVMWRKIWKLLDEADTQRALSL